MRLTSRHLRQRLLTSQHLIEFITLRLRTGILPIGTKRMRKRPAQLLLQRLLRIQALQQPLCVCVPIHAAMLLPRATNALHAAKIEALFAEPLQDAVKGLQPQRDGREDFMFGLVGLDALFNVEAVRVGVEVEDGGVDDLEVGVDDQAFELLG